jgi:hypothetical protein
LSSWITSAIIDGCVDISTENPDYQLYLGSGLINCPASLGTALPDGVDCTIWGDVNFDGKVDERDLTEVTDYVYKGRPEFLHPLPPGWNHSHERGDVDCSGGAPNPADVVKYTQAIYQHALHWILTGCD